MNFGSADAQQVTVTSSGKIVPDQNYEPESYSYNNSPVDDIFLDLSQPGTSVALDAQRVSTKMYVQEQGIHRIAIRDGKCNSSANSNKQYPANSPDQAVDFNCLASDNDFAITITLTDENEATTGCVVRTLRNADLSNINKSLAPQDQWSVFQFSVTETACPTLRQSNASGSYVVVINAEYDSICDPDVGGSCGGQGKINAFQLAIPNNEPDTSYISYRAPGIQFNPNGTVNESGSVAFQQYGNRKAGPLAGSSYALQNRELRAGGNNDRIAVSFQVPCTYSGSRNFYLRWHDADRAGASGGAIPADDDISWNLFKYDNSSGAKINLVRTLSANEIGGQDDFREWAITVNGDGGDPGARIEPGDVLFWEWTSVQGNNGVQLWVPFDSAIANKQGCTQIKGQKQELNNPSGVDGYIVDDISLFHLDQDINTEHYDEHMANTKSYQFADRSEPFPGNSFGMRVDATSNGFSSTTFSQADRDKYEMYGYSYCVYPIDTPRPNGCHNTKIENGDGRVVFSRQPTDAGGFFDEQIVNLTNQVLDVNWYYEKKVVSEYDIETQVVLDTAVAVPGETYSGTVTAQNVGGSARAGTQLVVAQSPNDPNSVNAGTASNGGEYRNDPSNAYNSGPDTSTDLWYWAPNNIGNLNPTQTATRAFSFTVDPDARTGDQICFYSRVTRKTPNVEYGYSPNNPDTVCVVIIANGKTVFAANHVNIRESIVRDNQQLNIEVGAYIWPDAGHKVNDNGVRFWLAGVYGDNRGDVGNHPNLYTLSRTNSSAEQNCPGPRPVCANSIPFAYLPQDDGSGTPNTTKKDGSRTPLGNNWYSIRDENFGSSFNGELSCIGLGAERFYSRCGGVASNSTSFHPPTGLSGSQIVNVETSNIRIEALGLKANEDDMSLQSDISSKNQGETQRDVLAPGNTFSDVSPFIISSGNSQGPIASDGTVLNNVWDNIREPQSGAQFFNVTSQSPNIDYDNNTILGRKNFDLNPFRVGAQYKSYSRPYTSLRGRSLLQDGNDNSGKAYDRSSEPLSYTAEIESIDQVNLKWDEYVEWTQMDDKGHYYPTQEVRAIGVNRGNGTSDSYSLDTVSTGFQESFPHWHDSDAGTCGTTRTPVDRDHDGRNDGFENVPNSCNHTHYTSCTNTSYNTGVAYHSNTLSYYSSHSESRYGWLNTRTVGGATIPKGPAGSREFSRFGNNQTSNPGWANTGAQAFWQDQNIGQYDSSGRLSYSVDYTDRWRYDTNDPLYTNQAIFTTPHTPSFYTGWYYTASNACVYPNGDGVNSGGGGGGTTSTYYSGPSQLYESSACPGTTFHGACNTTQDGVRDDAVNVGWNWVSNQQRVRYENSWFGHRRRLGAYPGSGQNVLAIAGLDPDHPVFPSRDSAQIVTNTISLADANVFASGFVDSYFQTTNANSAFIFTNNTVGGNVSSGRNFTNYYINPDEDVASTFISDDGRQPHELVFTDYSSDLVPDSTSIGSSISGTFNLGDGGIYRRNGNLTLGNTTFTNGEGTIIVEGDLTITGNAQYTNSSNRDTLPSVGFIVLGDIRVQQNVSSIVGAYFTNGCFHTGSVTVSNTDCANIIASNNSTAQDLAFNLDGLVVARRFALVRQRNVAGAVENFRYDGRIVLNTPPGFSRVFSAPAIWNEGVPID